MSSGRKHHRMASQEHRRSSQRIRLSPFSPSVSEKFSSSTDPGAKPPGSPPLPCTPANRPDPNIMRNPLSCKPFCDLGYCSLACIYAHCGCGCTTREPATLKEEIYAAAFASHDHSPDERLGKDGVALEVDVHDVRNHGWVIVLGPDSRAVWFTAYARWPRSLNCEILTRRLRRN